ncbi:MAG: N-acetylmannosamine-6-phosphate 2-epimerase [Armatimonadota bacterium]|nr:N-acetylmannosamine-6-phosphate 2-epimerase [Armatimonadota bacterium]MDR7452115.1 N-acetylmannosamine-6-phosphate 2-epimerase [Armatimonadota bacterium]MDR7467839.1 N-acetylmannosamine-6-phosphate 2-epimerase [Armatimonadota bacterium]MDR7494727.1 N-acetylmannosamine-6-phosphate 2-epimerase [Armatimonadota bacterium]MDR7499552.1 N-acetylmannosamine-6-phosphate 2-epimerase [Armatimonadota bacterium]
MTDADAGAAGLLARLRGGLIVSCQARAGHPLHDSVVIRALARAAEVGGAAGLRINGEADIRAVREAVDLPIIGIRKVWTPGTAVYITPTVADAAAVAAAGADIIALDATARPRSGGSEVEELIPRIRRELGKPVMADISTLEEGRRAEALGADLVATTLAGYTGGPVPEEPDLDLVAELARALRVPVVAEGRYRTPEQVVAAFRAGAFAVVVGRAITDALDLTRRFVEAIARSRR